MTKATSPTLPDSILEEILPDLTPLSRQKENISGSAGTDNLNLQLSDNTLEDLESDHEVEDSSLPSSSPFDNDPHAPDSVEAIYVSTIRAHSNKDKPVTFSANTLSHNRSSRSIIHQDLFNFDPINVANSLEQQIAVSMPERSPYLLHKKQKWP